MPTMTTVTPGTAGVLPPQYGALITEPVTRLALSVDPAVATLVNTAAVEFHLPIVRADAGAGWIAEGTEITEDLPSLDEIVVRPSKVAGLSVISREVADDSNPSAQKIVGDGLARSIVWQLDQAFFGALAAPAPPGLESVAGVVEVDSAGFVNLDSFAEAQAQVEEAGGTVSSFVAGPATALELAQLKAGTGSNAPLLGVDPTGPGVRRIGGVDLKVSPHVAPGVVWAIDSSAIVTVWRDGVALDVTREAYFSSDRVGIRAVLRVGFGHPLPGRLVKIAPAPASA